MDDVKRSRLRKCRETIVRDLHVEFIIDDLCSENVITKNDMDTIMKPEERTHKVRCLLDTLTKKENKDFEKFVEILMKDYVWLAQELIVINMDSPECYKEQMNDDDRLLGDIPQLPHNYVQRTKEMDELGNKLKVLRRESYVVLYGFACFGKSILAVSTVMFLKHLFNNRMYFINAGEAKTETDIVNQLNRLCKKLNVDLHDLLDSRKFFNGDKDVINVMKDKLKKAFISEPLRGALLILDDVSTTGLIEAFNFGCKVLVTTRDKGLVPSQYNVNFYELNRGFHESETLQMFKECTRDMITENNCKDFRLVHELCKGHPMIISLIGIVLKDCKEESHIRNQLNKFIKMLDNKKDGWKTKFILISRQKQYPKNAEYHLFEIIENCLAKLPEDCRLCYEKFALFVEDVNILPQVFQVILNKSEYEVEEILLKLCNKSLIVSAYNEQLQNNVYGIHDLMLSYLKQKQKNKMVLHSDLIESYLRESGHDFSKLPNDNYIYTYIGYHLSEAGRTNDFPTVYFDLNFVSAKIRACGVADLIGDYKRYKMYITNNEDPVLLTKLESYEKFVQEFGQDIHRMREIDIVQCGIQQTRYPEVYEDAMAVAFRQCDSTLYLQTQFFGKTVYIAHTLDLKDDVGATCYAHKTNKILVGNGNGEVQLWDHNYKIKLGTFKGHTQRITHLQLTFDNETNKFLSVSEDGCVKVWCLEDACELYNESEDDKNGFDQISPSPRIRQKSWMNFHSENRIVNNSTTFNVEGDKLVCASFSNDNCYLMTGSEKSVINIWRLSDSKSIFTLEQKNHSVICCTFSLRDSLILFACENIIYVYNITTEFSAEYLAQFVNDVLTTSLLVVPYVENKIIAVSDKSISIFFWNQKDHEDGGIRLMDPVRNVIESREDTSFICGSVTWDGTYVVAASTDQYIRMWNIDTKERVKEIQEHSGLVMCLDTFLNDRSNSNVMYILLSGSNNRTVKQWQINSLESPKKTSKLTNKFSVCWLHCSVPLVAAINTDDQIQVFSGHALISESQKFKQPKCLAFSPDGKEVAVGLASGIVIVFEYRNKVYYNVMNLNSAITYIEYLTNESNITHSNVLCAASENACLMVCKDKKSVMFKQPESEQNIQKGKACVTVQCFLLADLNCIISVEADGSVKIWYFNKIKDVLVASKRKSTMTMCAISKRHTSLVLIFSDGNFRLYDIHKNNSITCEFKHGHQFTETLRSCCFSDDGKLLALGADSGNIMLWSIENKMKLTEFRLHNSWVRYLRFSPIARANAPLVLVSAGDQIVWWDISHIWKESTDKIKKKSRNRASAHFEKLENLVIDLSIEGLTLIDEDWIGKVGRVGTPELLSTVKMGHYVSHLSASPTFSSFVTVDASGLMYIMNVLKRPNEDAVDD